MRRPFRFLAALPLLAACATAAPAPQPVAAEILRAVLVVHLSDGTRCVALTPFTEGQGRFGNCPGLGWRIIADPASNPLRIVVERGLALMASNATIAPLALIEVSDAQGRVTRFDSPAQGVHP